MKWIAHFQETPSYGEKIWVWDNEKREKFVITYLGSEEQWKDAQSDRKISFMGIHWRWDPIAFNLRKMMKRTKTKRGFRLYTFQDTYKCRCSLQMSSIAHHEAVFLGSDEDQERHDVTGELLTTRMHINRKTAREIGLKLIAFAETGELP